MAARSAVCLGFMMLVVLAQQATAVAWWAEYFYQPKPVEQYGNPFNKDLRDENCIIKPDSGRCYFHIVRFYFDVQKERCRPFFYTGCRGNGNNFASKTKCENACAKREVICPDGRDALSCVHKCSFGGCPTDYMCLTTETPFGVCCPAPLCPDNSVATTPCSISPDDTCSPGFMCQTIVGYGEFCCPARCSDGTFSSLSCDTQGNNTCPPGTACINDLCCPARCNDNTISPQSCANGESCALFTACTTGNPGGTLCCPVCPGGIRPNNRGCNRPVGPACDSGYTCITAIRPVGVCCPVNCPANAAPTSIGCIPGACPIGDVCNVAAQSTGVCCTVR